MSNTEHSAGGTHRSFRCTFGPVREVDLVWPPADEDIDAFSVVHLDDGDAQPTRLETPPVESARVEPPRAEPVHAEAARPEPIRIEPIRLEPRRIKPTFGDCRARSVAPRVRPFVVPMEPPPLPGPASPDPPAVAPPAVVPEEARVADVPADDSMAAPAEAPLFSPLTFPAATWPPEPEAVGARRSAWVAVFFAAACALATVAEYRGVPEEPPVPAQVTVADVPAPVGRAVRPSASPKPAPPERMAAVPPTRPISAPTPQPAPAPAPAPAARPAPEPRLAVVTPRRDVEPAPPVAPRVTVDVRDRGIVAAAKVEPRDVPAPAPTPAAVAATAGPEPFANAAPTTPVAAVLSDAASDEAGIQSTLTRFRTAYSQLNASAARDVWPSVDARALERAFQSLKSQDLRFDSCTMTVTGARAHAACKGRAVYVPRIGDQSPRFTAREWNFELRKADERWTIASARSL